MIVTIILDYKIWAFLNYLPVSIIIDYWSQFTYILYMRIFNRIIFLSLFIGFIGIQFVSILDDPQHLVEPDPQCPLCLAAKTEISALPTISFNFTPEIILYLIEETPFDRGTDDCLLNITIRAPPFS